jgi:predicted glutamine amidotransferase
MSVMPPGKQRRPGERQRIPARVSVGRWICWGGSPERRRKRQYRDLGPEGLIVGSMCRLLGWATREQTSLLDLLGEGDLYDFTELSCKHGDGWGLALPHGSGVDMHKQPDAARMSDEFADWARTGACDLGMVHLRWATLGLDVRTENTHPFTDGRMAFAHNGSILPPASLDRLLSADARALRRGDTDSERYFLAVLSRLEDGATPAEALRETVAEIAATETFSSLNCLLLTPDALFAVSRFDPAAPLEDQDADYFSLRYRVTPDAVVVASTGWGRDWQELANGEMLIVQRGTLDVTISSLEDLAHSV